MRLGSRRSKGVPPTGAHFAGGDALAVGNDGEGIGVDFDLVVVDGAAALAGEVEVGVVGKVAQRVLVGDGLVVEDQFVVVGEGIGDHHAQRAGIALLAVGGGVLEDEAVLADALDGRHVPELAVKADVAAVQVGRSALVFGQRQFLAVQNALPLAMRLPHAAESAPR